MAWPRPYPRRVATGSRVRSFVHRLPDGTATTVHVAAYPARRTRARLAVLGRPVPLASWCAEAGVRHAVVGGFFVRQGDGTPLGELWVAGRRVASVPFDEPWAATRSCVAIDAGGVSLAPRDELPDEPRGDLLQAGPLLVAGGRPLLRPGVDPEGFSANNAQFDSDITVGRYPRAALGVSREWLVAIACDGRAAHDAGMTLPELADLAVALGCERAINLDGGGSTSLVHDGVLRNVPREEHGIELVAGRPVATAIVFEPA